MNAVTRLFDIPYHQLKNSPSEAAFVTKYNGKWEKTSTQEYIDKFNKISRGLLRLGIEKNDKIAVISSNNRTEWHVLDMGILQIGAQNVPVYPTISLEDYEYIFNHAECKYCFVSDKELLDKITSIQDKLPNLKGVYTFDDVPYAHSWKEILDLGEDGSNQEEVEKLKISIQPNDLATIIYTSGTTARPKGVMLSHNNIISNVIDCQDRLPVAQGSRCLSFLPVCHIFERMLTYFYQYNFMRIYFAESIDKMGENIKEVKPHLMTVVPRVVEKVYDKIYAKGAELKGISKRLFFWALELGLKYEPYGANGWWYNFQLGIARKLIFKKWKEALGGELEMMVSGSAALQPRLARVFSASGLNIMEGYGLTETSPVIAVNRKSGKYWKIGTVGRPINNIEVKIAEDGEILCKGANVMLGYYKDPELTKDSITEGFFHTGDIGELDSDGFLKITDRKKEIFKTSGGKYIAPQTIENLLKQSRFIEQAMVVGEGEKMPAAIIQLNFSFVKEWAKRRNINLGESNEEVIKNPELFKRIEKEVEKVNNNLGKWEKIKLFAFTPDEWSIDTGELTPTLKLKRRNIKEKYIHIYNSFYNQ
ncbi:AMP-dependent synthetase [Capnocytophaga cynodegmi]|uniref:AMP-dependent synthetase/ligase n=1 Tax=Capnocytophaga cynodegmi TaxID=28189 RepID=UPI001EE32FAF|nr:long-chain fatty acid--CoA ligase [Capnocytophaga cynodegmi]GJQ06106.1 AMP-dependent synthetase [Capnocytophaga cynodegmi]